MATGSRVPELRAGDVLTRDEFERRWHAMPHLKKAELLEGVVYMSEDGAVDWFVLRGGLYDRLAPDANGALRSEVFPGLWLDAQALLRGDDVAMHAARTGLASPEHAAFAAHLAP
jgi:hypothetical protein